MSTSAIFTFSAVIIALAAFTSVVSAFSDFGFGRNSPDFGHGNSLSKADFQKWGNGQEKRQMMGYDDGFGIWSPSRNKFINWQAVLGGSSKRDFGNSPRMFGAAGRPNTAGLQNWRNTFIKRNVKRAAKDVPQQ